jgi:nicotinate-nucleotide pyrophosphorylase (carboxylating)
MCRRMSRDFQQIEWDAAAEEQCRRLVQLAVAEDLERQQDWTTVALVSAEAMGSAVMAARRAGIVAGLPAARVALAEMDSRIELRESATEGSSVAPAAQLALLTGPARSLLTAERIVLNLVGRLSGIATLTRRYVDAVAGTKARIYDTRKTMPGWRRLEKYAVRKGGGFNHRLGLFDAVLIKDNHLRLGAEAGGGGHFMPAEAVRRAKVFLTAAFPERPAPMIVEVEVDALDQLREVLGELPDIVLLDNMPLDDLRAAVAIRDSVAPHVELEASGGVQLETVAQIARAGVDRISVGALTHSAAWFDVGLDWQ